jgi:hypothetical protein
MNIRTLLLSSIAACGLITPAVAETLTARCADEAAASRTAQFWIEGTQLGFPIEGFIGLRCERVADIAQADGESVFFKEYLEAPTPATIAIYKQDQGFLLIRRGL